MERNLAERLKEALGSAEWDLLQRTAEAAAELNVPLYVVGGVPRDLILGQPVSDFDLVVEGNAQALARLLRSKYGGKVILHGKFGTANWKTVLPESKEHGSVAVSRSMDLITARSETYKHPAALPTVQPGTIADDLRRRDFTINALAIRLDAPHTGEVDDEFGGWEDIEAGVVRVLHEGSFLDDPTRMYRAVRYEQRYGFELAEDTLALIPAARPVVGKLSAQRIRHELDLTLDEAGASAMLSRLEALGLLAAIHPVLAFGEAATQRLASIESAASLSLPEWPLLELRWLAWLLDLPEVAIQALNHRLHFGAALYKALVAACRLWAELGSLAGLPPSRWVARLDAVPPIAVYAVYLSAAEGLVRVALREYLVRWRHIRPNTTGHELKRLGLQPGVQYKQILGELRRAWLDGDVRSEQDEQAYLQHLLARLPEK